MTTALQNYHSRMQRVLDYVDQHLDGDLDLETVSSVAAFSKFHFHRQFAATFEMSVHRYVQLARMKHAAQRLASNDTHSITDIAMDAGYDTPDAFARAFRQRLGQSPSTFRSSPDWESWITAFAPLDIARAKLVPVSFERDDVAIREVPPTPVAILEHRGDRSGLESTFERFRAWRGAAGLSPDTNPTFTIFRSERFPKDPANYSLDLCIGTDAPLESIAAPMKTGVIPGGRCAVLRFPGNTDNLEPAALYLYRDWLPGSGEEARDFPLYGRRQLSLVPQGSAREVVTELFLPLS